MLLLFADELAIYIWRRCGRGWRVKYRYLLQMSLQFVSGVGGFGDSGVEGDVDGVELRPHLVGASAKRRLDVVAQTLARRAFLTNSDKFRSLVMYCPR